MRQILVYALLLVSTIAFSQKNELKIAKKLISKGQFSEAEMQLSQLQSKVKSTEFESYYYLLKGDLEYGKIKPEEEKVEYYDLRFVKKKTIRLKVDQVKTKSKSSKKKNKKKKNKKGKSKKGKSKKGKNKKADSYVVAGQSYYKVLDLEWTSKKINHSANAIKGLKKVKDLLKSNISTSLALGDFSSAAKSYEKFYEMRPEIVENLLSAKLSYQQGKDNVSASVIMDKLLQLDFPSSPLYKATDIHSKTVETFINANARNKAIELKTHKKPVEEKKDRLQTRLEYYQYIESAYINEKNDKKALTILKKARKEFPENVHFATNYAYLLSKDRKNKKAFIKAVLDVVKLDPSQKDWWFNLGVEYQNSGQKKKAIEAYDKVIELDDQYANAHYYKGLLILQEEQSIIDEINASLNDAEKRKKLDKQLSKVYADARVSLEKAHEIQPNEKIKGILDAIAGK